MPMESITREAIDTLLTAIESRDLRAVRRALHPDACWQNVPHPAAEGREAVIALLHGILCWSERVQWDVVRASIEGASGSVERVDRFWLQGEEHAAACHGVFSIDIDTRTVISVRDYVDLGEWRQRVNPVLHALASRTSAEVINGHLAALQKGVPLEVAAYFSLDAIIECPAGKVTGWDAVADYYATSDAHPGLNQLAWEAVQVKTPEEAAVDWRLPMGKEAGQLGRDHYEIRNGRIVRLVTTLQLNAL